MSFSNNEKTQKRFLDEYAKTLDIKHSARNAGYRSRTGIANAVNYLSQEKNKKLLYQTLEAKAGMLQITFGYIVLNYLKVLRWASEEDETGKPKDPALMLRALEGLTKQIYKDAGEKGEEENQTQIISGILNLDTSKI